MSEPLVVTSFETLCVLVIDDDRAILDVVEAILDAAIGLDVNAYVRKPVTRDSMTKAIHRAFNRAPALKAREIRAAVAVPAQA